MKLNSILFRLVLILAAFAVVPNALAADSDSGSIFVDAKVGKIIGGSGYATGQTSWGGDGGYLWKLDDSRSLGLELGYMHFGKIGDYYGNFGGQHIFANAISAGAHFEYSFGDDNAAFFQARGGLISAKFDEDFTSSLFPGQNSTDTWNESGIYFGFGIGRKITQDFSVLLAYSHYSANGNPNTGHGTDLALNWLGLVAEYQF